MLTSMQGLDRTFTFQNVYQTVQIFPEKANLRKSKTQIVKIVQSAGRDLQTWYSLM